MPFTLRQFEIFVEAARDGNFRKTAERLGITQPTISKHIRLLEQNAGGTLFERNRGSSARLSARGEALLDEAQSILASARSVAATPAPADSAKYRLRVVAGHYLHDRFVRPAIRSIYSKANMPDVTVIAAEDSDSALAALRRGDADIAFYTGDVVDLPGMVAERLSQAEVSLYAAPALAARYRDLGEGSADPPPLILAPPGSSACEWQVGSLAQMGIDTGNVVSRSQFIEVTIDQVVNGVGFALLFDRDAAEHLRNGRLVRLPYAVTGGHRCMVCRATILDDPRARPAVDYLREILSR